MVELSLDKINAVAPYQVQLDNTTGLYKFVSDYQVGFSVAFEENDLLQSGESYQFALTNYEGKKVEKMRKMLYEDYKARTGEDPITFNVL